MADYVHGYSTQEHDRLWDQANALTQLLHGDTHYQSGCNVLEAGCGVGAQTVILAANSPEAVFTSIDISEASVTAAKSRVEQAGFENVTFQQADIFNLPFQPKSFDHVFVCFVLEHLPNPTEALAILKEMIKPGGTITVIEGDHGSAYFHPNSQAAQLAIQCQIDIQARMGGNSLIGRELFPLLTSAGYEEVLVSPRMVYVDGSRPELIEGFTKNTFTAMIEGVGEQALEMGLIDKETWQKGIDDLYGTANNNGTFCYTFFKGIGKVL